MLAGSTDIVKRWNGTDPARVDESAERLNERLDFPWPALLEHLGVTVRVVRSMDRFELEPGSVDLFYSDSVLQFVAPDDLSALILQTPRFLQPSGLSFHVIECLDMHARIDRRVPPLAYLANSERAWRLMTSRYVNYENRLRMPEFVELFRRAGLESQALRPVVRIEDVEFVKCHPPRVARFDRMSAEEIAIRRFWLKCQWSPESDQYVQLDILITSSRSRAEEPRAVGAVGGACGHTRSAARAVTAASGPPTRLPAPHRAAASSPPPRAARHPTLRSPSGIP